MRLWVQFPKSSKEKQKQKQKADWYLSWEFMTTDSLSSLGL
jgi:hypothetical protein